MRMVLPSLGYTYFVSAQGIVGRVINARYYYYYYKVHAGSFPVAIIHLTLTWSTGSLNMHISYVIILMRAYTQRLGTLTASQHNIKDTLRSTCDVNCFERNYFPLFVDSTDSRPHSVSDCS